MSFLAASSFWPSFAAAERSAPTMAYRMQVLRSRLPDWVQDWLEVIIPALQILLIVFAAWLLQYLLRRVVRRAGQHYQLPETLVVPLKGLIRWSIIAATVLLVLERMGVSATVLWTAFTGFATVAAVAFFAAWSVLSNLFCALLIFTARPFRVGDYIEILDTAEKPGAVGRVVDINLLYTTLEDHATAPGQGAWLQIPNALVFQRVVRRFQGTPAPMPPVQRGEFPQQAAPQGDPPAPVAVPVPAAATAAAAPAAPAPGTPPAPH